MRFTKRMKPFSRLRSRSVTEFTRQMTPPTKNESTSHPSQLWCKKCFVQFFQEAGQLRWSKSQNWVTVQEETGSASAQLHISDATKNHPKSMAVTYASVAFRFETSWNYETTNWMAPSAPKYAVRPRRPQWLDRGQVNSDPWPWPEQTALPLVKRFKGQHEAFVPQKIQIFVHILFHTFPEIPTAISQFSDKCALSEAELVARSIPSPQQVRPHRSAGGKDRSSRTFQSSQLVGAATKHWTVQDFHEMTWGFHMFSFFFVLCHNFVGQSRYNNALEKKLLPRHWLSLVPFFQPDMPSWPPVPGHSPGIKTWHQAWVEDKKHWAKPLLVANKSNNKERVSILKADSHEKMDIIYCNIIWNNYI